MQVRKRTIRQMKVRMKVYFPRGYALVVAKKLRQKSTSVTIQQVYNFFNNIPVKHKTEIFSAAIEILKDREQPEAPIAETTEQH